MILTRTIIALATFALAFSANAEDGFKISGDFSTAYTLDSGSGRNVGDRHNSFAFDLAEVRLDKKMGNSGFHISIGYGELLEDFNKILDETEEVATAINSAGATAAGPKSTLNLTNAYFHHMTDFGLGLKAGRFQTFLGAEDYHVQDNMNYTLSYGYTNLAPKFHTGLELSYNIADMVDARVYVVNSSVNTDLDENDNMSYGVQLAYTGMENLTVKFNYLESRQFNDSGTTDSGATTTPALFGAEADVTFMELMAMYNWDAWTFGVDYLSHERTLTAAAGTETEASAIAAYVGWACDDGMGAALRYEMLTNEDGIVGGQTDNDIQAITLSGYYEPDTNARIMFEVRQDSADKEIFSDGDAASNDDTMMQYNLALMYKF